MSWRMCQCSAKEPADHMDSLLRMVLAMTKMERKTESGTGTTTTPGLLWVVASKEEMWRGTRRTSKSMNATSMVVGTSNSTLTCLDLSSITHISLQYKDLKSMLVTCETLRSSQHFNSTVNQQSAVLAGMTSTEIVHF